MPTETPPETPTETPAETPPETPAETPAAPNPTVTGWRIDRPGGVCAASGRAIAPGEPFVAAVRETGRGFARLDVAPECWPDVDRAGLIADWRTTMPRPTDKPKRFVDDGVLMEMFDRLESPGAEIPDDPAGESAGESPDPPPGRSGRVGFRFVLGLLLMRKRLVTYESSVRARRDGREVEVWTVRVRGRDERAELVNPGLDDAQIAEVTRQLGDVLNDGPARGEGGEGGSPSDAEQGP